MSIKKEPIDANSANQTADKAVTYVPMFISEEKIYPRSVKGRFVNLRWLTVWLTQLVFYGLPWLTWGGRQAVLFDLEVRRFYIFDLVLYPQDFIYLAVLLIICALSLFMVTAIAGRIWCGFGCPQTVYTEIFMWVEKVVEGDRQRRLKLDQGPWSVNKVGRKSVKHFVWLTIAFWTGVTFVGYFVPIKTLVAQIASFALTPWELFWVLFYGFATYGNAGFMREQVCKYMCPYARFQSAMFDKETLIVTYNERRGEPRGARRKGSDAGAAGLGDCVDCTLCVQVCPTGIDIRKGLQYECISCAACIDVCDSVMKKLDYAPGLISYSTQQSMLNAESPEKTRKGFAHLIRPRVIVYLVIWFAVCAAWVTSISMRHDFRVDIVRDRSVLARIVGAGNVENVYRLQLMNSTDQNQKLAISVAGIPGLELKGARSFSLGPAQSEWVVLRLDLPHASAKSTNPGSHPIEFTIKNEDKSKSIREKSVFYIPTNL